MKMPLMKMRDVANFFKKHGANVPTAQTQQAPVQHREAIVCKPKYTEFFANKGTTVFYLETE